MAEHRKRCNNMSRRSSKYDKQSKELEENEPEVENIIMNQLFDSENYEFIDVDISEYDQPKGYNPSPTQVIEIEDDEDMVTENTDDFINRDPNINNLDLEINECDNKRVNNHDNINHQTDDAKYYVDFVDCNISSEATNEIILGNSSLGESEKSSVESQSENEEWFNNQPTEIKNTVKVKSGPFRNIKTKRLIRKKIASKPIRKHRRQRGFPLEEHSNVNNKLFIQSEARKNLSNNIKTVKETCKSEENVEGVSNTIEKPGIYESENAVPDASKVILPRDINNPVRNHSRTKINKSVSYKPLSQTNEVEDLNRTESTKNINTNEKARKSISSDSVMSVNESSETSEYGKHNNEENMTATNTKQLNDYTILTNIISDSEEERMERYDYGEKPTLEVEPKDTELETEDLSDTESLDRKISEIYKAYESKKKSIPTDVVHPVPIIIDSDSDGGSIARGNKCNETIDKRSPSENISLSSYDCTASIDTNIDCSKRRHTLRNVFCKRGGSMSPTTKIMDFWNVDLNNAELGSEEATVESQFFDAPWPPTEKLYLDTDGELSGHSDFFRIRAEHPEIDKQHRSRTLNRVRVFNTNNVVVKNNLKVGLRNRNYFVRIGNSHNTVSDIAVKISYNKNNLMGEICNSNNGYFAKHMNMSSCNERNSLLNLPPPKNLINDKNYFCSGSLNRNHSEEFFQYLKIDKRRPSAVKRDLAASITDTKRRSLRMRIKNIENTITAETYHAKNVKISKCHINRSRSCMFGVADTINANMSVAEVLEILKSENNNKSDIEIVHNYLKPDLKLHTSVHDKIITEDNGLEKMICYDKPETQNNNLVLKDSSNKEDILKNIVKSDDGNNITYKKVITNRLNCKDNLETTNQISSKNTQRTMTNTLKCIKLRGELNPNLNMERDLRKQRILRSSYNISKPNERSRITNNLLENHLDSSRKATLINRRFKCKNKNIPYNIIKLRSGKALHGRSIQNSRLLSNKLKNNMKMIKETSKELKNTAKTISAKVSQNVNQISNNLENLVTVKASPKKILDFSGEIKLGQFGIQLNNICSKQVQISSKTCSAFTEKDKVKIIPKLENWPQTDSNLYESYNNSEANEDDSGIVSDEDPNTINEGSSPETICSIDEYFCDNESNCNTFVLRVRSNSLSVNHPIITKKIKRSNSVDMNNETEVDLDGLLELHKTYEKKVNLYSLASKEEKKSTSKLSLQNLAKDFDESDVVENILHRNNIIVVIRKQNVCFYEHENSSTFFSSPKYWQFKGKVKRYNPLKECRLMQVTNSIFYCTATCTVAYVEIFGRQRPVHAPRSSLLCEVTAAVYSFELNNTPQMSLVHLDYPMCLHTNVIFTVIPWERAVVLGYMAGTNCDEFNIKKYVINNHHRSVQKSYSLPKARFHCTNLHSIDDDIIVGYGNGQVVLWNHLTQEIIFTINKLFIKSYFQPQNLIDDLFQNTICVWTRLDSIMNTLHLLLYCKLKSYLALVLIQKNRKQYKVLHKYYISDKYKKVLDVTIGQYKLAINFDEGALAYDFPLDFQTDSSQVTNLKFFPPFTLFPNDRYVVHLENDVAFSMTVDRL